MISRVLLGALSVVRRWSNPTLTVLAFIVAGILTILVGRHEVAINNFLREMMVTPNEVILLASEWVPLSME